MNKITTYSYCTCGNDEDCLLRLVAGNDFTMRLSLTKKIEGADVPYYLDDVEDMIVNVVTPDGSRTVLDSFIDGQSRVIVAVDANVLEMYVPYSIELVWRDEPYDRRAATPNLFMYVATQQEATEAQDEIVAGPYDYQMTIENDIVYVAVGAIPEMDPFDYVTYVQLDNALSSYATIEYVNDAVEHMVDLTDYYTKEQIDDTLSSYVTSDALSSMGYITINEVPEVDLSSYTTFDDISNMSYATTAYVTNAIDAIPEVDLSSYTTFDDISAMGYITISDVPTPDLSSYVTEQELSSKGYITINDVPTPDLSNYVTYAYLESNYASYAYLESNYVTFEERDNFGYAVSYSLNDLNDRVTYLETHQSSVDLSSYVTEQELSSMGYITAADVPQVDLSSYTTFDDISAMGYITAADVPTPDLSSYTTFDDISAMGYITINDVPTPDLSSYVTYAYLENYYDKNEIDIQMQGVANAISYLNESMSYIDVDVDLSSYVTKTELSSMGYITAADVPTPDLSSYVTEQELSSIGYITAADVPTPDLSSYTTFDDISAMGYITAADVPTPDLSSYVTEQELSSMGYITAADVPTPDLSSYVTYAYLESNYVTFEERDNFGYAVSYSLNDLNDRVTYLEGKTVDLSSYTTFDDISAMGYITINDVPMPDLSSYVSYSYWESSNEAVAYFITQQTLKNIDIQNNYYSKAQTDTILSGYASAQDITNALRNYVTTYENEQQNEAIAYAISYLEDAVSNIPMPDLSSYVSYAYLDNYYTSYDIDSQMRGVANAISYNDGRITDISSSYVSSAYIRNIVQMTSAEYSQITPDTNTLYIII